MTQEVEKKNNQVKVAYSEGTRELTLPMSGDLEELLEMREMKEIKVHGKPLLLNSDKVKEYLTAEDSAIGTEEELGHFLESQLSPQDVEKIYNQQLHKKLVGQEFEVSEVGDLSTKTTEELTVVVPQVKLSVEVVEKAVEAIETDDMSKYSTFLPPQTEEEKLRPIRCVTGNTLRIFLNDIQEEDGGLDMDSQIRVYAKLLTNMPDEDPTKKYGLMQMRALMQYGDVVSNKNLRLSLTKLIEE